MIVKFGTYSLEFDNNLAKLFEEHVYDTIQESALAYVSARTGIEDELENCKQCTKEEVRGFILESVIEDLRLCGVSVNV